ncbi:hypothetical protein R1flu_005931 [Riccia fluitans]|uniref:Uncharacterized protein n=1 Tax=Riccia fluitans TaxID=41844 RepID=A0ABD1YXL5_9MARC
MVNEAEVPVTVEAYQNKEGGPSIATVEVKPDRWGTKKKQDTPKTPREKPKVRRKQKTTKKPIDPIEVSDRSVEAKQEEQIVLPKDSSQLPKTQIINQFGLSLAYGDRIVMLVLHILEGNRSKLEAEVRQRMTLLEIAVHLNKENRNDEVRRLQEEVKKVTSEKTKAEGEVATLKVLALVRPEHFQHNQLAFYHYAWVPITDPTAPTPDWKDVMEKMVMRQVKALGVCNKSTCLGLCLSHLHRPFHEMDNEQKEEPKK